MPHLQHLKWPIALRRQFILSLHGVSGALIEYSAHNCRYLDFRHSETLIWSFGDIFSHLANSTQNPRNGPSATPKMAYGS